MGGEVNSKRNECYIFVDRIETKDFVGGLWTVAHSRNFEWLFRILSGDSVVGDIIENEQRAL